jgi:hypothetical protein
MQVIRSGVSWISSIPGTWMLGVNCEISKVTRKALLSLSVFSLAMVGVEESRRQAVYALIALKKSG